MENYFNYFTEIEEHFQRRRGTLLLFSPLDWALIETWRDAGIPLEAVLRGIDATFDHWDSRKNKKKTRKVNGLGFCTQEVLAAAEEMKTASVGAARREQPGLDKAEIASYLERNAGELERVRPALPYSAQALARESASSLRDLSAGVIAVQSSLEDLERRLTVMEGKLFAVLLAATPDDLIVEVRTEADRELAPYRRNMPAAQIEQLHKQYIHKRLLEKYGVPRLSLFYM